MKRLGPVLAFLVVGSALGASSCKGRGQPKGAAPSPGASSGRAREEVFTVALSPSAVGFRYHETRTTTFSLSVEFWRDDEKLGTNELSRGEQYARALEVLALVGGTPSKERVHYERYRMDETRLGQPPRKDANLEGQTYVVDGSGSEFAAFTAEGKPAPEEEQDSLEKLHAGLGAEDPLLGPLSHVSFTRGVPAKLTETLFKGLMRSSGTFKGGEITFTGTKDSARELEWSGDLHTEEEGGLELDWHVTGKLRLSAAPARVLSSRMDGSVDASGQSRKDGQKVKMLGSGSIHDEYAWSPR